MDGKKCCTWGEKYWGKGRKGSFQVKQHPTGIIGSADGTALSVVFKKIPRSLVVERFGVIWVLGGF